MTSETQWTTESKEGVADLHMHTTASDGTITVDRRINLAADRGLNAIAITDHDVVSEMLSVPSSTIDGVEVIAGVEVRATTLDTKIELLGYFINPTDEGLISMLEQVRGFRRKRNKQLLENVERETGLNISYEELRRSVDGTVGRPHIADRLVTAGVVTSVQAAFDEYLADDGDVFVPMKRLPASQIIETIHAAGGVASLAHPGRIRADISTVESIVASLTVDGLDGIEAWYPYADQRSSAYAEIDISDALVLADQFDLIPTGGSDCHGPGSGKFRQGEVRVGNELLETLRPSRCSADDL